MSARKAIGFASKLPKVEISTSPVIEAMSRMLEPYQAIFADIEAHFAKLSARMAEPLRHMAEEADKCKRLQEAGWLPHASCPAELVQDSELSGAPLDAAVETHYRTNWSLISETLASRIDRYEIDSEAKATYREALRAHEFGLFRCAPRLLYPEIERVSRIELHGGSMDPITSQHHLQEAIGDLAPYDLSEWRMAGFHFYDQLREHLYAKLHKPEDRDRVAQSAIPNRHAVVHGLATYNSFKTSLNAILVSDFALNAISVIKQDERAKLQSAVDEAAYETDGPRSEGSA